MPTYRVTNKRDIENPRVVDAKTPGAARAHVARDELTVQQINVSEAFKLASAGVKLETAGEEVPQGAAPEAE